MISIRARRRLPLPWLAAALVLGLPVEPGRAQSVLAADGVRVAFRLDAHRVIAPLRILNDAGPSRLRNDAPTTAPMAKYGFPSVDLPDDWSDVRPADVQSGDRWVIEVSEQLRVAAVVEAVVAGSLGCSDAVGVRLRVRAEDAAVFAAHPARYFAAEPAHDPAPPARARRSDVRTPRTLLAPTLRARLESRLAALLEREWPRVKAEAEDDLARMDASEVSADRSFVRRVRSLDAALARHAAALTYDVQALQLSPDGEPVYFVRAEWRVGPQQAFAAAAWLRGAALDIVDTNLRPASWLRMWEFQGRIDREHLGIVLNVVDTDADGWGEVIVAHGGYESMSLSVLEYSPKGFRPTGAEYTYGC
jgi:hypothetical protein